MVKRLTLILLAAMLTVFAAESRDDTMTGRFDERIRTLRVSHDGNPYGPPVLVLGSQDRLVFNFDELAEDRSYFRYRIIHCTADWRRSDLVGSEYLPGFNEAPVDDYELSRSTTVHYVNYRIVIPNDEMTPLISGNYLLQVYREDDPERTVAQWRFMVSEQTAPVSATLTSRTDRDYNDRHQQLQLTVDAEGLDGIDIFNDLIVVVSQNDRCDNEVALRHPLRLSGRKAVYEHQPELIFEAGNEYRRFETVSVNNPSMRVAGVTYFEPYYHHILETDASRTDAPYSYDEDQDGRFVVREYNSTESDVEADYTVVHFSLDYPETPGMMIFVDGDLTDRRFDDSALMKYNRETGRYETAMLLKQGAYNYQYLTVPPGARRGYTSYIEGDKYQTVNRYTVKVYVREPHARYDRLVGVAVIK